MQNEVDLLLNGGIVVSMNDRRQVFSPGYVAITDGAIVAVGPSHEATGIVAKHSIRTDNKVVLPGFVNGHTHVSNGIHRGLYDELKLAEWIPFGMWPVLRSLTQDRSYYGTKVTIAENLLCGVTTGVIGEFSSPDHHAIDGALSALTESGMRAVVARICVDEGESDDPSQASPEDVRESIDGVLAEVDRLRKTYDSSLIEVVPEPLGVLRCSPDMVKALTAYARSEGTRMTMHVASSPDESEECMRLYGVGSVERLSQLGVLGPHLLIAHCVIANDRELAMLAEAKTGVSHNPVSNLMYAVGTAPLAEMIDVGVRVGLGTDGSTTNNGQNMWETMKMAMFLQKARFDATWGSGELALELATIGGARAIGMDDSIGSLEVGKRADMIVVDLDVPQLVPRQVWPSNLVYSNHSSAVRTVIIDGKTLVDDGQLVGWDMADVATNANRAAEEVNRATGLADRYRSRTRWEWIES